MSEKHLTAEHLKRERDEALQRVDVLEQRIRSAARMKGPVSVEALYGEQLVRERAERERDEARAELAQIKDRWARVPVALQLEVNAAIEFKAKETDRCRA